MEAVKATLPSIRAINHIQRGNQRRLPHPDFDKKIPARARLENPHDDEGCAEANHSLGLGTQTTGILPGKFVWGICFTPTPFSAQANRVGKLGG